MNLDFSAWLVLLTLASGGIWAFDALVLARRRRKQHNLETVQEKPVPAEHWIVEYARSFFPVFLIVLILRSFIVEPFRIPSASMMPTLLIGDFILVNKFDYGIRLPVIHHKIIDNGVPERGDIIVFRSPEDPSVPFIKRVIGVPGDHVKYVNKTIYINDMEVKQQINGVYKGVGSGIVEDGNLWFTEFLDGSSHDILANPHRAALNFETTVPAESYFVLGDNRDNSRDSRYWGFVPDDHLVGRAFYIWMNWDTKNGGIGWNRIGTVIE